MTDDEIDEAIAQAVRQRGTAGLDELVAVREQVEREREPLDPAIGRIWQTLVRVAERSGEDVESQLVHGEGRARWLAAARGPDHVETLAAWIAVGDLADLECAWDVATRAWEAIAATAMPGDGDRDVVVGVSRALRGLAARRRAAARLDDARALFARDLALNERLHPAHPQLAISLGNLADIVEQQGDRVQALTLRERQRDVLQAAGAQPAQLDPVDAHITRLHAASAPGGTP
jgi:hypothetical protein